MDSLKKTENDLNEGKRKLEKMIQQIETEEVQFNFCCNLLKNAEFKELKKLNYFQVLAI